MDEHRQFPDFVLGREVGRLLCEAFGLPPERIRRITLRNPIDDVATLEVERILTDDEGRAIKALLRRYRLVAAGASQDIPLDVQSDSSGQLTTDTTDLTGMHHRHAAVALNARIRSVRREVTRHDAAEPEYIETQPSAGGPH